MGDEGGINQIPSKVKQGGVSNGDLLFIGDRSADAGTGGKKSFAQWVHCEFVVSFEAIHPVITQQVCGEFF